MALKKKQPSGVILLLVILIVTAILSTSAIFGGLVLRDIQQSRLIDQSMQAFYLAESGVERALHQVRHLEAIRPQDCDLVASGSICDSNNDGFCSGTSVNCITADQGKIDWLKGDWQITVSNEKDVKVHLLAGESVQIDLFNPYQNLINSISADIESFLVTSNAETRIYGELNNLTWLLGGTWTSSCPLPTPAWPTISRNFISILNDGHGNYTSSYLTALCDSPGCLTIDPDCSYILRLSNNVSPNPPSGTFNVSIYDKPNDSGTQLDIPSRLVIDSQAIFGRSLQKVRVKTPIRPPLSGLYDFVVFSEQQIVK